MPSLQSQPMTTTTTQVKFLSPFFIFLSSERSSLTFFTSLFSLSSPIHLKREKIAASENKNCWFPSHVCERSVGYNHFSIRPDTIFFCPFWRYVSSRRIGLSRKKTRFSPLPFSNVRTSSAFRLGHPYLDCWSAIKAQSYSRPCGTIEIHMRHNTERMVFVGHNCYRASRYELVAPVWWSSGWRRKWADIDTSFPSTVEGKAPEFRKIYSRNERNLFEAIASSWLKVSNVRWIE